MIRIPFNIYIFLLWSFRLTSDLFYLMLPLKVYKLTTKMDIKTKLDQLNEKNVFFFKFIFVLEVK